MKPARVSLTPSGMMALFSLKASIAGIVWSSSAARGQAEGPLQPRGEQRARGAEQVPGEMKPSLCTRNVIEMRPLRQYLPGKASPNQGTITRHCLRHISRFGMEVAGRKGDAGVRVLSCGMPEECKSRPQCCPRAPTYKALDSHCGPLLKWDADPQCLKLGAERTCR